MLRGIVASGNPQLPDMDIFPAIDLLNGQCVRLYQGDYDQVEVFGSDPAEVAARWVELGATNLHVVDLTGAKAGETIEVKAIRDIVAAVGEKVTVQVGGGLRDLAAVDRLLATGVKRAILGTVAVENPELVKILCDRHPGRIIVGIDARDGLVATRGWLETSTVKAIDLAKQFQDAGVAAIVYTDIQRDGTLAGPNIEAMRALATEIDIPLIASGGVGSLTDLMSLSALEPLGVTGAIVGKALYAGTIDFTEALHAVGPHRWQDVPPNLGQTGWA